MDRMPQCQKILALRCDFPSVPHLNLRSRKLPKSLCITEQAYSEWKLHSTAITFVEEIRQWLISTAKGTLHADDQPLEPLLVSSEGALILPSDLFTTSSDSELLFISLKDSGSGRKTYIAKRPKDIDKNSNLLEYVAFSFLTKPQTHGIIRSAPETLFELHKFLEDSNVDEDSSVDLLDELRSRLKIWRNEYKEAKMLEKRLALIIGLPKMRDENTATVELELCAFLTVETIKKVGIEIGLWDETNGMYWTP